MIPKELSAHTSLIIKVKLNVWRFPKNLIALVIYRNVQRGLDCSLLWKLENNLLWSGRFDMNIVIVRWSD